MSARGLVLGKFMPYHKGHELLIKTACSLCDHLTVLVCSNLNEPIDGAVRHEWLCEAWGDSHNVSVCWLNADVQQAPINEDDFDFWITWRQIIAGYGDFDMVLGGEEYVVRLGATIGAEPVIVDRELLSVSGTQLRESPDAHWNYLSDQAKPFYQQRVTVLGPESTGKSTLSSSLAGHSTHMTEYGRVYDTKIQKGDWSESDFERIAKTHIEIRKQISLHAGPVLFEDTDIFATAVWSDFLIGGIPEKINRLLSIEKHADLYLILSPDVPWIDDGTRMAGEQFTRIWFFDRTINLMKKYNANYKVISGGFNERRSASRSHVFSMSLSRS